MENLIGGQIRRILIVDDEPAVVNVLTRYIRREGYDVRTAGSAEEAINLTGKESFDLIVLDVVLPGITGFGAIEALKGQGDIPIIMMSGCVDEETRKDAESLGADALIAKPVEFETLMDVIHGLRRNYGLPR